MSDPLYEELRVLAELAARIGGATLMHWRDKFEARPKGVDDLVTNADVASQQAIARLFKQQRPDDLFVGEEQAEVAFPPTGSADICWVVDPLDGTVNYVHGFPFFATSVGAVQDQRVVAGAIFDPLRGELFSASLGGGATLNGRAIGSSSASDLSEATVAISLPPSVGDNAPDLKDFIQAARLCRAVRRTGSAALNLAYVGAGRLDAHWAHEIKPWDAAAGVLVAAEGGASVTACNGEPYDVWQAHYLVASTPSLHAQLAERLYKG